MTTTKRSKPKEIETSNAIKGSRSKHPTSYKLTDTALEIVSILSRKRGIAKSALIENLLRDEYQAECERAKESAVKSGDWNRDRNRRKA